MRWLKSLYSRLQKQNDVPLLRSYQLTGALSCAVYHAIKRVDCEHWDKAIICELSPCDAAQPTTPGK